MRTTPEKLPCYCCEKTQEQEERETQKSSFLSLEQSTTPMTIAGHACYFQPSVAVIVVCNGTFQALGLKL